MSYIRVMLHCVWSTKERYPYLIDKQCRYQLFKHMLANAREKDIFMDYIGGEKDHIHCLLSLGSEQTISKLMQLIKGEASYWFNKEYCSNLKWQDDYFAVSISQSQLPAVRLYIQNQEEHHRVKTFQEEYEEFMSKYCFTNK